MPLLIYATNEWYGPGCGAAVVATAGALSGDVEGYGRATATMTGAGSVESAHVTGLKNSPCTMSGIGTLTEADIRARANMAVTVSIGSRPSPDDITQAIWNRQAQEMAPGSIGEMLALAAKLLRNKTVTDPATGVMTVYDDNGSDVLLAADVYEDAAGTQPYDGQGVNRRERLA